MPFTLAWISDRPSPHTPIYFAVYQTERYRHVIQINSVKAAGMHGVLYASRNILPFGDLQT
jgi:hypothetical protein